MQPLISVIIPVYKAEKYLRECVDSVIDQTYSNLEIILVDDGSPDGCPSICDEYAVIDRRCKVIHKENGGVCTARNAGLDASSGEYVAFLDADDTLLNDSLEKLYSAIEDNDADISIGWKTNVTEEGKNLGCPYRIEKALWKGTEGIENSLKDHPACYAVWGKLYNRNAIMDIRFEEGRKVHEDSFFFFQCLLNQPKVVLCDFIVLNYRLSVNSASRSVFSEKYFDILFFAKAKKNIIESDFPGLSNIAENMFLKANIAMLSNLIKFNGKKYKEIENQCIKTVIAHKHSFIPLASIDNRMYYIIIWRLYWIYKFTKLITAKFKSIYCRFRNRDR